MLTFLDPRTTVSSLPQASGGMPPWGPGNAKCGIAFEDNDDHPIQIILPALPLTSSYRAITSFALHNAKQLHVGSLCSTCGQATVCSACNQCHYCNDINLPCVHLQKARRCARIAVQFHQMTWRAEEPKTPESLPTPIIGEIIPQSDAEADILRRIHENLGLPTDRPSSEKKEGSNA